MRVALNRVIIVFAALSMISNLTADGQPAGISFSSPSRFKIGEQSFDLSTEDGITKLSYCVEQFIANRSGGTEPGKIAKRDARGLARIVQIAREMPREPPGPARDALKRDISEIAYAISNNHRSPVPSYVGLPDLPFRLAAAMRNPVGVGQKPAANVVRGEGVEDLSAVDPERSSYWQRPESIRDADLYAGFGRAELPTFDHCVWNYAGAKKAGGNPGVHLLCGSQRIKVKFAETHSEPFTGRIFHALGYNVDASDYSSRLTLKYDRRFFTEFNQRREIKMKIGVLFIPIYTFHFERFYDPFAFVDHAVLKNGATVSGKELKQRLLRKLGRKHGECDSKNFRDEVEADIESLVTTEANVQVDRKDSKNIGPWDFEGLGREHLREVRGAGVLAAWLGWWDSRFENTGVRLVETSSRLELKHFFTDLGSGLGRSGGTFRHSSEEPNDFTWSFTQGKTMRRNGKPAWCFEIEDFEPITETAAFREMTQDDARWMARLIAQLSEEQIVTALIASGFDSAEVRIYTEKLLARREQLIRDTQLEFPSFNNRNRDLNYDPVVEGPMRARTVSGFAVEAPIGATILRSGRVERRAGD